MKNIDVSINKEELQNDENGNLERKLVEIYRELLDFRIIVERFIRDQSITNLTKEIKRKDDELKWAKDSVNLLSEEAREKMEFFKKL